jgi:hypothetical protein
MPGQQTESLVSFCIKAQLVPDKFGSSECNLDGRIDLDRVAVEDNRFVAPLADCVQS